jgi:hypothetical protein
MPPASGGTGEQQQQQPMDCASLEADKDHDAMFNDPVSLRAIISEYRTLKARVPQLEADLEVARADATEARLERAAAAAAADRPPPRPEQSPWLSLTNGTLVTVSGLVGTCKERSVNIMLPHIGIAFHLSRAIFELAPQVLLSVVFFATFVFSTVTTTYAGHLDRAHSPRSARLASLSVPASSSPRKASQQAPGGRPKTTWNRPELGEMAASRGAVCFAMIP